MSARWTLAQFFEKWWWKNYLAPRAPSEYLTWKRNYWVRFFEKIGLQIPENQRVLDVGGGPAGVYIMLEKCAVTAVDPLFDFYEKSFPHFKKAVYPNAQFFPARFEDFTVEKPFDWVFCLNVINHVADLEMCIGNLAKATRRSGQLILSVDAHNFLFFKYLFRWIPGDILHPQQFSIAEYAAKLSAAGFEISQKTVLKKAFIFNYWVMVAHRT